MHSELAKIVGHNGVEKTPLRDLELWLTALKADAYTARQIPTFRRIEAAVANLKLTLLMDELRRTQLPAVSWPLAFQQAWLRSCLEHAWAEDSSLAAFNGRIHDGIADEFCELDSAHLRGAAKRVELRHAQTAIAIMNSLNSQSVTVRHEAEKKIRHLPFRKLMDQAPDVLTSLFPCFMCSPLSVSQLLPGDRKLFDLVVFDEASQVLPEDAVASLVRGSYAVVAGDEHQLPPTQFFAGSYDLDEEPEDPSAAEGFESLLKMMKAFVPAPMLQWHYRSRDERLIAFSNRHIYGDQLITFPGPGGSNTAITHIMVDCRDLGGPSDSDSAEVRRVVEIVLEHAKLELEKPPDQQRSMGVIASGIIHARRVEAAIDRALEEHPELEPFFNPNLPERFFVKNLERVQGDERDIVILTLGVAPDASGRVSLSSFGPLNNRENGHRRLNVAITRARYQVILVSSFSHHSLDVSRGVSRGIELLWEYLKYAASGGMLEGARSTLEIAPNPFEADIASALADAGIQTIPQWGVSSYRLDLVAVHPVYPGRFVLAIECDGATYHSAPTARDRDRLRQQHLQALGWKFHRIWSTDWFHRRSQEIQRAKLAFQEAVAHSDRICGENGAK